MSDLIVIGSLNMDLVIQTPRFPDPGETIQGGDLATYPGGKGANQAVAASKQGMSVAMIGMIGKDQFGPRLLDTLRSHGVDTHGVRKHPTAATGTALILVDQKGENVIVLSSGANAELTPEDVDQHLPLLKQAKYLLMQFEIPFETVMHAAETAHGLGLTVILNPAPGRDIPQALLEEVDILVPNESELSIISNQPVRTLSEAKLAARSLIEGPLSAVVVTLGRQGAYLITRKEEKHYKAPQVDVVDTTAAGDSFIGGLSAALGRGETLSEAVKYGNYAGALATTRTGAQPSLPTLEQVQRLHEEGQ